ncbi:MAG: carboxypeptidase regulatory-like domain-containing protein [Pseudomonadota bacterium]
MTASFKGVVVSPEGCPVPGAAVVVKAAPVPVPDIAVLTDSHGHFALDDLPSGQYVFQVKSRGDIGRITVDLFEFAVTEVTIQLANIADAEPRPDAPVPDIGVLNTAAPPAGDLEPLTMPEFDPDEAMESPPSPAKRAKPKSKPQGKKKPATKAKPRTKARKKTPKPDTD